MKRAAGCLVLLALLAGGCGEEPTVEQQIIAAITEMESRGEEGRRSAFMEMVHESFIGQQGAMTRDEFRLFMIMAISSREVFPARSPIPFMVTSTCLAPLITPLMVLAVAIPRSL